MDIRDDEGTVVFVVSEMRENNVEPGDRIRFRIKAENPLSPGEYELGLRAISARDDSRQFYVDSPIEWTFLAVDGHAERWSGVVEVPQEITATVLGDDEPAVAAEPSTPEAGSAPLGATRGEAISR